MKTYKLPIPCPECKKPKGVRLTLDDKEDDQIRVICIECEDLDQEVSLEDLLETMSALVEYVKDKGEINYEEVGELVTEKLDLEEE